MRTFPKGQNTASAKKSQKASLLKDPIGITKGPVTEGSIPIKISQSQKDPCNNKLVRSSQLVLNSVFAPSWV
jgi:hypothetical protein